MATEPKPARKNKGGRPRLAPGAESTVVSVRLPNARYDALITYARFHRRDVSKVIREAIERELLPDRRTFLR